jgi:hypothetical protein
VDLPELDAVAPSALRSGPDVRGDAVDTDCSGDERRCTGLPKTRSGKVMRRILPRVAEGRGPELGDVGTEADPGVVDAIRGGFRDM